MNKTTIAAVLSLANLVPLFCSASLINCGGVDGAGNKQPDCGICDMFKLVNVGIDVIVKGLIPLAATLVIVYAGFKMIINQGDPDVAKNCKSIMMATAIGLVVVFASYAIVGIILVSMGSIQAGSALNWEPTCSN
jgi:hypothetical protein